MNETRKPLAGQVAVVTGASSGIGAAIAPALAEAGAAVVVNYVGGEDAAAEVVRGINDAGGAAIDAQADVSDVAQVDEMFDKAIAHFGTVDILVANAGIQVDAPIDTMTADAFRKVLDVNLTGQFICTRRAIAEFTRRGVTDRSCAAGKIICMSSVHDTIPWSGHVNYAASKGGVSLLMKSLAQEVAGRRIRVNAIAPGAIRTPINESVWSDPARERRLLQLIPYGRIGEPEDVARVAVWLASDESDYVVGTTIYVDGGMTLYPGFSENG